jgi:hypothetical protein
LDDHGTVILYAYAQHDAFYSYACVVCYIIPPVFYATRLGCALLQCIMRHATTTAVWYA